ncbi:MAG: hypothetical protein WCB62_08035, partial [Pseudolabrys sp.]
ASARQINIENPSEIPTQTSLCFRTAHDQDRSNYTSMKTTKLVTAIALSAELTFGAAAQAKEKHEEETVSQADVPMAVQKAAQGEAKDGRIVRWARAGKDYEAVIEKNGKKWGVEINGSGKVLNKHDESKEHKEKKE